MKLLDIYNQRKTFGSLEDIKSDLEHFFININIDNRMRNKIIEQMINLILLYKSFYTQKYIVETNDLDEILDNIDNIAYNIIEKIESRLRSR